MANFDSYVKNILDTLKICGVPTIAMRGCCDDDNLFPGADLYGSVNINIADGYINILGHEDMCIYKGVNNEVKGILLSNVSDNFLCRTKAFGLLYGEEYKTIKPHKFKYACYF